MRGAGIAPQDVAVVARAFLHVSKDGVRFADEHEALGSVRVVRVQVRVVTLGEGVEGSGGELTPKKESGVDEKGNGLLNLFRSGIIMHAEDFIVVLCCVKAVMIFMVGGEGARGGG